VYSDIASGKNTAGRPAFNRLMQDCVDGKVDLILTKSLSRFGRNTVEILENIYKLRKYDVDAIFEIEDMRISETGKDFLLSVLSGIAQEDSASRSENIRVGIGYKLRDGTSQLYTRPCYGYRKGGDGGLVIDEEQAENVRLIFDLYLQGHSVVSIVKELEKRGIKSPGGKDVWPKRAVEILLENEKYIGNVLVGKTYSGEFPNNRRHRNQGEKDMWLVENAHEPIIPRDVFEKARQERARRSNFTMVDGKPVRKDTHYSMKTSGKNGDE
jgi:DNA invertase Pin-like site-specific DNA recombinase